MVTYSSYHFCRAIFFGLNQSLIHETLLISVAEEIKKIDRTILQYCSDIIWQDIIDMRNVLAHDYRAIDDEIVFDVVKNELPKLMIALISFLNFFPVENVNRILDTKHYNHLKKII